VTSRLDDRDRVVLGEMTLAGATGTSALQTAASGETDPTMRLWSKTGLLTYRDHHVVLEVPEREDYWIGWGTPGVPAKRLSIRGCTGAAWTVFTGGFWASDPKCVTLIVRARGKAEPVLVGLGEPCPGQSPPAAPTER
jgi:hypothetical protein